jgi:hypothetical protein
MYDLNDIRNRVQSGIEVTEQEYAFLLRNDRGALLAFLAANNPGVANDILRHQLGYSFELGFKPEVPKILRTLEMMLQLGKTEELEYFIENMKFNESNVPPALLAELHGLFDNPHYVDITDTGARKTIADSIGEVGNALGGFINPIFGSSQTTTTTTQPVPDSGSGSGTKTSTVVVVILAVVVVLTLGYLSIRSKTT